MTRRRCVGRAVFLAAVLVTIFFLRARNELFVVQPASTARTLETSDNKTITSSSSSLSIPITLTSNHSNDDNDNQKDHYHLRRRNLCTREQIRDGEWIPATLPKAPYVPKNIKLRCYPLEDYKKDWKTWQWQPHAQAAQNCTFLPWNADDFCQLVKYTTVAIVGDSLSWEQYSSLIQLLGLKSHQTYQHQSKKLDQNHIEYACRRTVRLVFRRDDLLQRVGDVINTTFPQVLVLNRGAHYTNDTYLMEGIQQVLQQHVRQWQDQCRQRQLSCHLLWRTSVPGHPSCWNFSKPVQSITDMEAYIANPIHYDRLERQWAYHWYDYQHQNELVLQALSSSSSLLSQQTLIQQQRQQVQQSQQLNTDSVLFWYDVMDAYHFNILRPDEHRWQHNQSDCLHSCYPGKMDLYNQLLLHFLTLRGGVAITESNFNKLP